MRSFLIYWAICCFHERPRELFPEKETPTVPFTIIRTGRAFTTADLCCRYINIITMPQNRVSTTRNSLSAFPLRRPKQLQRMHPIFVSSPERTHLVAKQAAVWSFIMSKVLTLTHLYPYLQKSTRSNLSKSESRPLQMGNFKKKGWSEKKNSFLIWINFYLRLQKLLKVIVVIFITFVFSHCRLYLFPLFNIQMHTKFSS